MLNLLPSCGDNGQSQQNSPGQQAATPVLVAHLDIPRDSVINVQLSAGAAESYDIYCPSSARDAAHTPVFICFDPHGDGALPVVRYRKLADKFGIAIACSNTSRNGLNLPEGAQIAADMIADITSRLGFDLRLAAVCGFSGGAKVALSAAEANPGISRAVYSGAVTALKPSHSISLLGFAGDQDMNYTDLLQYNENNERANPNTGALIEWGGKHEWPDAGTFESAFWWLAFQTSAKPDSVLIKTFLKRSDNAISKAERSNDPLAAYRECHTVYIFLNGRYDVTAYKAKMDAIAASDVYKKAAAQKSDILGKEANEKQNLMQALQNQGPDWWAKVISRYRSSQAPSDKRLLGFISLACYSYSNQMLQQNNLGGAERLLAIYELADPQNGDQLYFHAILYARKNDAGRSIGYLTKAIKEGGADRQKIEAEPAFQPLLVDPAFIQALASSGQRPR